MNYNEIKKNINTIKFIKKTNTLAIIFFYKDLEIGYYVNTKFNYHASKRQLINELKNIILKIQNKELNYKTLKNILKGSI